jgi:hypothetical protein
MSEPVAETRRVTALVMPTLQSSPCGQVHRTSVMVGDALPAVPPLPPAPPDPALPPPVSPQPNPAPNTHTTKTSAGAVHNPVFFMTWRICGGAISGNETRSIWATVLEDALTLGRRASGRQPPEPVPIREEPHHLIPTRHHWVRRHQSPAWAGLFFRSQLFDRSFAFMTIRQQQCFQAVVMLVSYATAKLVAYCVWATFGVYLSRRGPGISFRVFDGIALGVLRWMIGFGVGVVVFFLFRPSSDDTVWQLYFLIYIPIRCLEWGFIAALLVSEGFRPFSRKMNLWVLGGIAVSILVDLIHPDMIEQGRFCVGRCLC